MRLNKHGTIASLILAIVLLAAFAWPAWGQSAATRFSRLIVNQTFTSIGTSTLTGAVTTGGDVTVGDDATVTDDLAVTDDVTTGGSLLLSAQSVITVTNGATLSPTGSYQPIASAAAVGFGAITVAAAGTELVLVNTVNQTITITDTGTLKLAGNIALGQYDALRLISDGTNWIQVAPVGNN